MHVDRERRSTAVGTRPICERANICVRWRSHTSLRIAASEGAPLYHVVALLNGLCQAFCLRGNKSPISFFLQLTRREIYFTRVPYPISGALADRIPPPSQVCVRRHTHTEPSGRVDTLGDTATTKSRVVPKVSARRLPPRETISSRRTRASNSDSTGPHVRVLAPTLIAASFMGNSASLFRAHLPCYN